MTEITEILKINKPKQSLTNDEFFSSYQQGKDLIIASGIDTTLLGNQWQVFLDSFEQLDNQMTQERASILTEDIGTVDKRRRKWYSKIWEKVRAAKPNVNATKERAADKLLILFDTYGSLNHKNRAKSTSIIYNIGQDLTQRYSAEAGLLDLQETIDAMIADNQLFNQLSGERHDERISKPSLKVSQLRDAIYNSFGGVACCIEAAHMTNPANETIKKLIQGLNSRTTESTAIQKAKETKAKNKKEAKSQAQEQKEINTPQERKVEIQEKTVISFEKLDDGKLEVTAVKKE
jgi:hypothetical protein